MGTVRTVRRRPARIERHRGRRHGPHTQNDSRDRRDRRHRTGGLPAPGRGRRDAVAGGARCRQAAIAVCRTAGASPAEHGWISVDMTLDASVQQIAEALSERHVILDGAVLMPPQDPPTADALPSSDKWREVLQNSFVGPLALLKAASRRDAARPDTGAALQDRHRLGHLVGPGAGPLRPEQRDPLRLAGRGQDAGLRARRARHSREHAVARWHAHARLRRVAREARRPVRGCPTHNA